MRKKYVICPKTREYYRSFSRIPISFYCFSSSDITVYSTKFYKDARRFRFLFWATHRARFLSRHSEELYYVYEVIDQVNGIDILCITDNTINDRLIKAEQKAQEKIDQIIEEWKKRKGLK